MREVILLVTDLDQRARIRRHAGRRLRLPYARINPTFEVNLRRVTATRLLPSAILGQNEEFTRKRIDDLRDMKRCCPYASAEPRLLPLVGDSTEEACSSVEQVTGIWILDLPLAKGVSGLIAEIDSKIANTTPWTT